MDQSNNDNSESNATEQNSLATQVEKFLLDNPGWLCRNQKILRKQDLHVSQEGVSSLLEYQVINLRQYNENLQRQLEELNENAIKNQIMIEGIFSLCNQLVKINSEADIYSAILRNFPNLFEIEHIEILIRSDHPVGEHKTLSPEAIDNDELISPYWALTQPACFVIDTTLSDHFFGAHKNVASLALIPLLAHGQTRALCLLGSQSQERYHPDKDITFLTYITKLLSNVIENQGVKNEP